MELENMTPQTETETTPAAEEGAQGEDFDLFGDLDGETSREENEEKVDPAQQQSEETGEEKADEVKTITLKYNGQTIEKPMEEVLALAQKGMNYDKVKSRLDEAEKQAGAFDILEQFATEAGMTVEEYVKSAKDQWSKKQVEALTERGMEEAEATELLSLRAEKAAREKKQGDARKQQEENAKWAAFVQEFPEVAATGKLEKEVIDRIAKGESPVSAQRAFENKRLREQLAALQAGEKNKQTAPGSAKGLPAGGKKDPFLEGLSYE